MLFDSRGDERLLAAAVGAVGVDGVVQHAE